MSLLVRWPGIGRWLATARDLVVAPLKGPLTLFGPQATRGGDSWNPLRIARREHGDSFIPDSFERGRARLALLLLVV